MSGLKKLVIFLFVLVIILPIAFFGYSSYVFEKLYDPMLNTTALNEFSHKNMDGIKNILILGTDARPGDKVARTDAMMILTLDSIHKDIKITSLARDTFVDIPGHGYSKLTHAYAFGKEDLLIRTIEKNFDIDINDFVLFNFESFMTIIDSFGGIEVNVTQNEIKELNKFIPENYKWDTDPQKGPMKLIEHTGTQVLNGYQALSYARIRHNDSAFMRDKRQRIIMSTLLKKAQETPKYKYPFILSRISKYIKTNITPAYMIRYGVDLLKIGTSNIHQMEFPLVNDPRYATGGIYGRYGWVERFSPESVKVLKDFIFEDIMPDQK